MVFRCCDKKHIANRRAPIWSGLRPSVCSPANNQGSVERQKKPTRQVDCEITKDGVVTVKSTQLGEWDLEAIQAHADFLSLKDTELNLKELKASRHTPTPHNRTLCVLPHGQQFTPCGTLKAYGA